MKERIRLLDILRGFAILGTLGTNVWFFAYAGDTFATDQIADEYENGSFLESLVSMFVYGKMLSSSHNHVWRRARAEIPAGEKKKYDLAGYIFMDSFIFIY